MRLYDPIRDERDACGIGFVADARGRASRAIVDAALDALCRVKHRGAVAAETPFFPGIDRAVLVATIAAYQKLGCWTPHVEITRPAFEATLDVFQHAGLIKTRHRYEDVIAPPPDA